MSQCKIALHLGVSFGVANYSRKPEKELLPRIQLNATTSGIEEKGGISFNDNACTQSHKEREFLDKISGLAVSIGYLAGSQPRNPYTLLNNRRQSK